MHKNVVSRQRTSLGRKFRFLSAVKVLKYIGPYYHSQLQIKSLAYLLSNYYFFITL